MNIKLAKYTLYLLGKKGLLTLNALILKFGVNFIAYVVIGRDKNIENDYANDLEELCIFHNIKYFYYGDKLKGVSDFTLAIGWRWMIQDMKNLIILHDSLLPKYRGFAPLVNSLINGEDQIGVTALWASDQYDRGNIIIQSSLHITYPIKIAYAIDLISQCYIDCCIDVINKLSINPYYKGYKQDETMASYSLWRDEQDYFIDWNQDSTNIKRFVDSVGTPYGGAKSYIDSSIYTLTDVESLDTDIIVESRSYHIGKVVWFEDAQPIVICKKGLIKILELKDKNGIETIKLPKFRVRFS